MQIKKMENVWCLTAQQTGFRLQVPEHCSSVLLNIFAFRSNHKRKCTVMKFNNSEYVSKQAEILKLSWKQNTNFLPDWDYVEYCKFLLFMLMLHFSYTLPNTFNTVSHTIFIFLKFNTMDFIMFKLWMN